MLDASSPDGIVESRSRRDGRNDRDTEDKPKERQYHDVAQFVAEIIESAVGHLVVKIVVIHGKYPFELL